MSKYKYLLNLAIAKFLFFVFTPYASATLPCTNDISGMSLDAGSIIVQRDTPIGSAISNDIYGTNSRTFTCNTGTDGIGTRSIIKGDILSTSQTNSAGQLIFQTNIPGIGITIGTRTTVSEDATAWSNTQEGFIGDPNPSSTWTLPPLSWGSGTSTSNTNSVQWFNATPKIKLWVIGKPSSGVLNGAFANYYANNKGTWSGTTTGPIPVSFSGGQITVVACSITTPTLNFPIGNVLAEKFGTSIGTIPANAQNTQDLGLNCDVGANINVRLQGAQNADVSTTSVLALTGQGDANVAKGVGVQLLYNGVPLELNNRIALKQSSGGQETFPITARYYQTKTSVSTGKANASATLDLTYQ